MAHRRAVCTAGVRDQNRTFQLRDAAAIVHPDRRTIAYHLFWDDDIDFPDDNDPSDHEVVWCVISPDQRRLVAFYTYFHNRVLEAPPEALRDAAAHLGRPSVAVQWGKHGSMPVGWQAARDRGGGRRDGSRTLCD